jgi:DedD protein
MDSRAKQRLTGAIILVALFVLLVPELLTGPKGPATPATPAEEGIRRYTIDLDAPGSPGNQPAADEPSVNLPAVGETPAPASQLAVPGESAAPEATASAPAGNAPAANPTVVTPMATRPESPAPRPVAPATVAEQPKPQSPKPQTATPTNPATPANSGKAGSFVVQLGSFGSKENAERLVRDMTAKGFATFIAPITTNGRELYRVRVGPTRDRASAEALAAQLKRMGQSGSIVPIS